MNQFLTINVIGEISGLLMIFYAAKKHSMALDLQSVQEFAGYLQEDLYFKVEQESSKKSFSISTSDYKQTKKYNGFGNSLKLAKLKTKYFPENLNFVFDLDGNVIIRFLNKNLGKYEDMVIIKVSRNGEYLPVFVDHKIKVDYEKSFEENLVKEILTREQMEERYRFC